MIGISECVADEGPSYSAETVKTAQHVIEDFIAPIVFRTEYAHPDDFLPTMRHVRGHNMAKAAVEMGLWEAYARARGESLSKALGGTRREIASGVSIGIQDSVEKLLEKIEMELADGYRRIKMKIKPGWDVERRAEASASAFPTPRSWSTRTAPTPSPTSRSSRRWTRSA